jgi:hypothetical protein
MLLQDVATTAKKIAIFPLSVSVIIDLGGKLHNYRYYESLSSFVMLLPFAVTFSFIFQLVLMVNNAKRNQG